MKGRNLRNVVKRLDKKVRGFSLFLLYVGGLVYKESKASVKLGFLDRLRAYFKGFTSESIILYRNNPTTYDLNLYVTDYQRYNKAPRLNERHGVILADKNLFTDYMYRYRDFLPIVYGMIINGKIIPLENDDFHISNIDDIQEYLKNKKAIVFKPVAGYAGHGILICKWQDKKLWMNNSEADFAKLEHEIRNFDNYIISEYVFQADYASNIYPRTANTIRAFTIYNDSDNKASVVAAIHRFGTDRSYPVDNFTKGSLSTFVNLENGKLGMSASHSAKGKVGWLDQHPDTGSQIKGVKIHNWPFINEKLKVLAEYAHYTPVIGWDIISTNDGLKIIEANDSPGVDLIQIHKPLLLNSKLYEFYRKNKILKKRQIRAVENRKKQKTE